jgi:hypothetical protein
MLSVKANRWDGGVGFEHTAGVSVERCVGVLLPSRKRCGGVQEVAAWGVDSPRAGSFAH